MMKVRADGRKAHIRIKDLPSLELRLKRPLPSSDALKSLRLVKRPNGWYADLTYEVEKPPLPANDSSVGLDMVVNNRIALSTSEMVERREVDRIRENRLRQAISREVKGSRRRRKAVATLSQENRLNAVRNRNEFHQVTTDIVHRFGNIAVEKLEIKDMSRSATGTVEKPGKNVAAKSGLSREILAQTWGLLLSQLRYKAAWAGRELAEVNPRYTSRICSECGGMTRSRNTGPTGAGYAGLGWTATPTPPSTCYTGPTDQPRLEFPRRPPGREPCLFWPRARIAYDSLSL